MKIAPFEKKKKVFIVSACRTGTTFLGEKVDKILPDTFSVHEPDNIPIQDIKHIGKIVTKIRNQGGFWNQLFLKSMGLSGARNLSISRIQGKITQKQVLERFFQDRKWVDKITAERYVESNQQLFGFSEDLLSIPHSKVIYFVRNPFDWTRSMLNHPNGWYGKKDLISHLDILGFKRITPKYTKCMPVSNWNNYGQVEKLIWMWNYLNDRFLRVAQRHPHHCRVFRYEDIFKDPKIHELNDLLYWLSGETEIDRYLSKILLLLKQKVHSAYTLKIKPVIELSNEHRRMINLECSAMIRSLGYS